MQSVEVKVDGALIEQLRAGYGQSATGFFAFEFERRGATVVSVDLPSIADWDMPHIDREPILGALMDSHKVRTLEDLHHLHIDGPLTPQKLGHTSFDMIFAGDILLHTFSPLAALVALAPLCDPLLVIAQQLRHSHSDQGAPLMLYGGGDARGRGDSRTWWHPNKPCLEQMLKRVGFKEVKQVDQHPPYSGRGEWLVCDHAVIHATK